MTIWIIVMAAIAGAVVFLLLRKRKTPATPPPLSQVPPSEWRPMLGVAQPEPVKRTRKYRIQYQSNGFDRTRPKQIEKTAEWLQSQGAGHLVEQFKVAASWVVSIPDWIDEAYDQCAAQYRACGGKYAAFIAADDPSTISVEVVATPMKAPSGVWAGGMAFPDLKTVRCVVMACGGMKDNPATIEIETPAKAHLALFKNYVAWEIGNLLGLRYGYHPKTVEEEWGNLSPCR